MRISRVFTDQPLEPGRNVTLEERSSHYLTRVLKLRRDDPLVLFNGDGSDYAGQLVSSSRPAAEVALNARLPAVRESPLSVTLVQAISRGERMDISLQKSTELGVTAIQPIFTSRVEVRLEGSRLERRMTHWQGVLRSACEQCGRAVVPRLGQPVTLAEWVSERSPVRRIMLDPGADAAISGLVLAQPALELLVGPEGGISEQEAEMVRQAGVESVRLGPRVLRTETAGPAALAALQAIMGDF
ncbi:MAG: 16S rRNA (uracil(1498)-N(3))-methyltransferase [Lysobacterales bacterium]|jgi:16S rRNA (uracil1498-N3)-methyltransferase